MQPEIVVADVDEGTDAWNLARIVTHEGAAVLRAGFSTWDLVVTDRETGATVYSLTAQPNTDSATFAWFDTLSTTGAWGGRDSTGYNMRHIVRNADVGAGVLRGGHSYRFEYNFVSAAEGSLRATFVWNIKSSAITA